MKEKKNAVITFRTEEWVKDTLQIAAEQNKWSVAQTVNELCKKFAANPQPEEIIIKISDLANIVKELESEGTEKAVRLFIGLEVNETETDIRKKLDFEVLECGGAGLVSGFDTVYEMTEEEIRAIP